MTPKQLLTHVRKLNENGSVTAALTHALGPGRRTPWYRHQKEHWEGWLGEYDGPGAYDRNDWHRDAGYVYGHIQCAPMLLWLAEAAGLPKSTLTSAKQAVLKAGTSPAGQCAALRRVIPWSHVEGALSTRGSR
jgi:hypothetical protein